MAETKNSSSNATPFTLKHLNGPKKGFKRKLSFKAEGLRLNTCFDLYVI